VLRGLGHALPAGDDDDQLTEFAVRDAIVQQVLQAARERPVLVVLDDLHWADASSLRALRLLVETPDAEAEHGPTRLMVLLTWRSHPSPTGPLGDLVEVLARRHATRLELSGLSSAETAQVVRAVSQSAPTTAEAGALRERTDGNPFFLVEYARLAAERGGLEQLLAEEDRPTAVRDVLVRRLARLPQESQSALRVAGVIGRQFDLSTLATASGTDEDALLDALEPAVAAGLVREDGIDRFTFAHALVRDTAYGEMWYPAGPGCTPGWRRCWRARPDGRPRWPTTGPQPDRRTGRRPGGRRWRPPPRPAGCTPTWSRRSCWPPP
jgi:predicted ATPase